MDEVFGRQNYRNSIITKKCINSIQKQFSMIKKLNVSYDTILMYSKSASNRIPKLLQKNEKTKGYWCSHWHGTDRPTMRYELLETTPKNGQWCWSKERSYKAVENFKTFSEHLTKNALSIDDIDKIYEKYLRDNDINDVKEFELIRLSATGKPEHYVPPSDEILLSENWLDLLAVGRITTFEHEKNEFIIQRVLDWITNPGDLILDSFLGSGTTAAVAQKMGRRWIGIELGDHAYTHCRPRLQKVIDGSDQSGISKSVGWKGGGGFRFYELASVPS
jgi:adenine-specific DNA-methyltransferase